MFSPQAIDALKTLVASFWSESSTSSRRAIIELDGVQYSFGYIDQRGKNETVTLVNLKTEIVQQWKTQKAMCNDLYTGNL